MPDSEQMLTSIYNGFINRGIIQQKYVSREECRTALAHGRRWYGTKDPHKYLKKTLKRVNENHKIHTGTFSSFNSIMQPKIQAEQEAKERAIREAAAREKTELLTKFNQTQNALNEHRQKLITLNQQINTLNSNITTLNIQRTEDMRQIGLLNEQITNLQNNIQSSTSNNQELVRQITSLQLRSQTIQNQLIEKVTRIEQILRQQQEINNLIFSTNSNITSLTQSLSN